MASCHFSLEYTHHKGQRSIHLLNSLFWGKMVHSTQFLLTSSAWTTLIRIFLDQRLVCQSSFFAAVLYIKMLRNVAQDSQRVAPSLAYRLWVFSGWNQKPNMCRPIKGKIQTCVYFLFREVTSTAAVVNCLPLDGSTW